MTETKLVAGSTLAHARAMRRIIRKRAETAPECWVMDTAPPWGREMMLDGALEDVRSARVRGDTEGLREALATLGALVVAWLAAMEEQ